MSSDPPAPRRAPNPAALLVGGLALVLTLAVTVGLVLTRGGDDGGGAAPASPASSGPSDPPPGRNSLSDVDTTALTVQRAGFCDLVAPDKLERALGGAPTDVTTYGNGERVDLSAGVTDIAHEFGCRWKRGRATARAWVFAPPVTAQEARRLVRATKATDDCARRRGAPAYGAPSLAQVCSKGKRVEASYRGLFGDAWLTCSLTRPGTRPFVVGKTGPWCLAVADAAAQPPA